MLKNMSVFLGKVVCKSGRPEPGHVHTIDCKSIILEHAKTHTSTRSKNTLPCEFPNFVMDTVSVV